MKRTTYNDVSWRGLLYALAILLLLIGLGTSARAQHEQHTGHSMPAASTPTPTPTPKPAANAPASPVVDHSTHTGHTMPAAGGTTTPSAETIPAASAAGDVTHVVEADVNELMVMSAADMSVRVGASRSNFLSVGQMGSGTAWQPASSPLYMLHKRAGDWLVMFHFDAKTGVNHQGGPRGVTKAESMNWIMPMAFRRVGAGTLQLRGMLSFEPFTFPPGGSPLLFQTGETYKGEPLIDKQHPHDLVMELSAQYTAPLGERGTWFAYLGYPGEPALGPVAFMHRMSASENPSAPLAHHLQDSTHISFGVLTSGFTYRGFRLEGSIFNGREPDENRYNFEYNPWNARAARLSYAPSRNWTFQVSHGFLRNPEALEAGDTRRTTASVQYNRPFNRGNLAAALVWGRNHESHAGDLFNLNGYTGEATVNFLARNYLYTRLELVDKRDLLRHADLHRLGFMDDQHPIFRIGAYTLGYVRDVWTDERFALGLGGDVTAYSMPAVLDPVYGRNPTSFKFFFRIRPNRMRLDSHAGHTGHGMQP